MQRERRLHRRKLVCIPCRVEVGGDLLAGRSYDLTSAGAAIITDAPLQDSLPCRIQFLWVDGRRSETPGLVRYSRPIHQGQEYISGVSFVQGPDSSVQELLSHL